MPDPSLPGASRPVADAPLWRRVLVTIAAPLVAFAATWIPLPYLADPGFNPNPEWHPFGLGRVPSASVVALGLTPIINALLLVEIVALFVPRWSALRHAGPAGRVKLGRAALWLGIAFALFQAYGVAIFLEASSRLVTAGWGPRILAVIPTLVGGTLLLTLLAGIVDRHGLGNGFVLLVVSSLLTDFAERTFGRSRAIGALGPSAIGLAVLATAGVAAAAAFALGVGRRAPADPPNEAREREEPGYREAHASRPSRVGAIPAPASGTAPLLVASSVLAVPSVLASMGVPIGGLQSLLAREEILLPIQILLTLGFGALLAFSFNHPAHVATLWQRARGAGAVTRDALEAEAAAELRRATRHTLAFLALAFGLPYIAQRFAGPVPAASTIALATALVVDWVREVRARSAGQLVSIWSEQRAYAMEPARAALAEAGIPMHVKSHACRTMLQLFGPYAPVEILVAPSHVAEARAVLERVLLPRPGDESARRGYRLGNAASESQRVPEGARTAVAGGILGMIAIAVAGVVAFLPAGTTDRPPRKVVIVEPAIAVSFEILPIDDDASPLDAFEREELPRGMRLVRENVPIGPQRTKVTTYALVLPVDGESREAALVRTRPWFDAVPLPPDERFMFDQATEWDEERGTRDVIGWRSFLVQTKSVLSGHDLAHATPESDTTDFGKKTAYVAIELTPDAGDRFYRFTQRWVSRRMAIVVDGKLLSAPVIRSPIAGGHLQITMGAAEPEEQLEQARRLAKALHAGQ